MELTQLKYFQAVAKSEHMTKTAESLHISQSSLSKTIARLEDDLGIQLFHRSGNKIKLSHEGELFLSYVNKALSTLDTGTSVIKNGEPERITFAVSTPNLLTYPLEAFTILNPNTPVKQLLLSPAQMKNSLENFEIDFAVSYDPVSSDNVNWEPLFFDEIVLVANKNNDIAKQDSVDLAALSDRRFMCNNSGFGMRELIDRICHMAGFHPTIIMECNESELLFRAVGVDSGILLIPELVFKWKALLEYREPPFEVIKAIRISSPESIIRLGIATRKDAVFSRSLAEFIKSIRDYFGTLQANKNAGLPMSFDDLEIGKFLSNTDRVHS